MTVSFAGSRSAAPIAALVLAGLLALGAGVAVAKTIDCPKNTDCSGTNRDDTIRGKVSNHIEGKGGDDSLFTSGGKSALFGGPGNDTIEARGGANEIRGGTGNDEIRSEQGGNDIFGDTGNDDIEAKRGANFIQGGPGDDTIAAGGDNNGNPNGGNRIEAGDDDDTIDAANGEGDAIDCGQGDNEVTYDKQYDEVKNCEREIRR